MTSTWKPLHDLHTCRNIFIIVHPESFRSNAQNAITFARRNRPCVNRSDEFACVLFAFPFACICDGPRARVCVRTHVRACVRAYVLIYVRDVNSI